MKKDRRAETQQREPYEKGKREREREREIVVGTLSSDSYINM
jgi:hypothetical protein